MATVKRLSGNVDVGITGKTPVSFTDYGVVVGGDGGEVTYSAIAQRNNVFTDPTGGTVSSILSVTEGKAYARSDGKLGVDLNDVVPPANVVIVYNRTGGTSPGPVTATILLTAAEQQGGWGTGDYWLPELQSDAVVVEPHEDTRFVYVSLAGITVAQIATADSVSEAAVNGAYLRDTVANVSLGGDGVVKYGETATVALDNTAGISLYDALMVADAKVHALFRRGDTFTEWPGFSAKAYSKLHPAKLGAYGSGARPKFDPGTPGSYSIASYSAHLVVQDVHLTRSTRVFSTDFILLDNLVHDGSQVAVGDGGYPVAIQGTDKPAVKCTLRRHSSRDAVNSIPGAGRPVWGVDDNDRISHMYIDLVQSPLVERFFGDVSGWQFGYRVDRDGTFPQSPTDRSHGIYFSSQSKDVTIRDAIVSYPSFSVFQARPGGVFERIVGWGHNTGMNLGNGPDSQFGTGGVGNWSLTLDTFLTSPGQKDTLNGITPWTEADFAGEEKIKAGGINLSAPRGTVDRAVAAHGSPGTPITSFTDIGPVGVSGTGTTSNFAFKVSITPPGNSLFAGTQKSYNYVFLPSENISGLNTATLDATTIEAWADAEYSTTGSTLSTIRTSLRADETPWGKVESILRYFMVPFGFSEHWPTPRVASTTVNFLPRADGATPGFRADIRDDWETLDLPGSVSGDNVNINGYDVRWNITPENPIGSFTFGGGSLAITSGILRPTSFTDAGSISLTQGSKLYLDGHSTNLLTLDLTESRFLNEGAASAIDITARHRSEVVFGYDGASFTIGTGRTVTLAGDTVAGFDGEVGGAASLVVDGTLVFRRGVRLAVDNMPASSVVGVTANSYKSMALLPEIGSTLTSTGGATGVVVEVLQTAKYEAIIVLDEVSGTFVDNEDVSGRYTLHDEAANTSRVLGQVNGTPVDTIPIIREFATGIGGRQVPNVASSVTLAATATITATGFPSGTYDLIDVDSLTDNGASLGAGLAVSGNKLVLTVA